MIFRIIIDDFINNNTESIDIGPPVCEKFDRKILEAISKKGFLFKFAAGPSLKPQAYSSISRILNEAPIPPKKAGGKKTFPA